MITKTLNRQGKTVLAIGEDTDQGMVRVANIAEEGNVAFLLVFKTGEDVLTETVTSKEDLNNKMESIRDISWLTEEEKTAVSDFFTEIQNTDLEVATVIKSTSKYGFEQIDVKPKSGGKVTIIRYDGTVDIGLFSSMNKHGLGSSDYIRDKDDVANHIARIPRYVWLTEGEKKACIEFLEYIRDNAEETVKNG